MTDHASEFIEQLHDRIIDLEDDLLDQQVPPRGFLALLRKQLIVMRRYMAPQQRRLCPAGQRAAAVDEVTISGGECRISPSGWGAVWMRSTACIARTARSRHDEIPIMQESLARRTYTMSLMAMVFLPSTF
ncbi:hypothetical protein LN650_18245 [Klebsiella pneumoniae subsp. pneumoniae]|nr:hypothetical protein [Klebsiella pneumoniae subsp. pneumoniae]